ncbi:hypothetical protein D030_1564, partial [Vibrio parahaemolyticus AQ3810]
KKTTDCVDFEYMHSGITCFLAARKPCNKIM